MKKTKIKIKKEYIRTKPRAGVKPSKAHKDKSKYSRKEKHKKDLKNGHDS